MQLNFVGVQGMKHSIHVEGGGVDERFVLTRGNIKTVHIKSAQSGVIEIECYDHQPSMQAEIVVLSQ